MALIIDEKQMFKLQTSKRKFRRGRAVKSSIKEQRKMRERMGELWRQVLVPVAEKIKQMVRDNVPLSDVADEIERALYQAEFKYNVEMKDIVTQWQMGVSAESSKAIRKGLSESLGVDISALMDTPDIKNAIAAGSMRASRLIKSIPGDYLGRVADAVTNNYIGEPQPGGRSLLQQIIEIGKVSKNRARIIARDQTTKLNATINKVRQTSIGISVYIWRTAKDSHVVGNPSGVYPIGNNKHGDHYVMEGLYCKWDDNTVYSNDKGKIWKKRTRKMPKLTPGQEILCRCFAEPIIDIDAIINQSQLL